MIEEDRLRDLVIPLVTDSSRITLEEPDYTAVPVDGYGRAMLRGMESRCDRGLKSPNHIYPKTSKKSHPKGVGLKFSITPGSSNQTSISQELCIKKGSHVKVLAGTMSGLYGTVVGLNEESGRTIIQVSSNKENIEVNDYFVQIVSRDENFKWAKLDRRYRQPKASEQRNKRRKSSPDPGGGRSK